MGRPNLATVLYFNPRSRMGSDLTCGTHTTQACISIHAPAWGATDTPVEEPEVVVRFQSTLPHGERRLTRDPELRTTKFQSTLPHGERHSGADTVRRGRPISIHAPAWGATISW